MSRFGIFKISGNEYDMDDLTLDEVEEIEDLSGAAFSEMNFGSAKAMKSVAFVLMKRTNPELSLADVGKVKVIDFLPADEEMPETSPPDDGEAETVDLNGSGLADAGALASAVSTAG